MSDALTPGEKFDTLTITAAVGLGILAFVFGVSTLVYGAVALAREVSVWLTSF